MYIIVINIKISQLKSIPKQKIQLIRYIHHNKIVKNMGFK